MRLSTVSAVFSPVSAQEQESNKQAETDPFKQIVQYLAEIRLEPNNTFAHRNVGVTQKADLKAAEATLREAL